MVRSERLGPLGAPARVICHESVAITVALILLIVVQDGNFDCSLIAEERCRRR
jgi:hypothetical protein